MRAFVTKIICAACSGLSVACVVHGYAEAAGLLAFAAVLNFLFLPKDPSNA